MSGDPVCNALIGALGLHTARSILKSFEYISRASLVANADARQHVRQARGAPRAIPSFFAGTISFLDHSSQCYTSTSNTLFVLSPCLLATFRCNTLNSWVS